MATKQKRIRRRWRWGGWALIILPTLVVGNELLILGGVAVLVGGWFLAHRYGKMSGTVAAGKNGG